VLSTSRELGRTGSSSPCSGKPRRASMAETFGRQNVKSLADAECSACPPTTSFARSCSPMASPPTSADSKFSTRPLLSAVGQQPGEWHLNPLSCALPTVVFLSSSSYESKGKLPHVSTKGFASNLLPPGLVQRLGIWRSHARCRSIRGQWLVVKNVDQFAKSPDWINIS
jgi:hypothetical protein